MGVESLKKVKERKPDPGYAIRTRMWRYCVGSVNKRVDEDSFGKNNNIKQPFRSLLQAFAARAPFVDLPHQLDMRTDSDVVRNEMS